MNGLNVLSLVFPWVSLAENPSKRLVMILGICHGPMVRPILQKCIRKLMINHDNRRSSIWVELSRKIRLGVE